MTRRDRLRIVIRIALLLVILVALVGCGANRSQLVGTWKGSLQPGKRESHSLEGGMEKMAAAMMGEMTLEFTGAGKVKTTLAFGSGVGDYTLSGNEVTVTGTGKDNKSMKLILDGETLTSKKDFDSDAVFVFKKVSSEDPGAK